MSIFPYRQLPEDDTERNIALLEFENALMERTNDAFFPLYRDKHRFLVLYGGGGSGKSVFAPQKILARVHTENGHRFLVVRKTEKSLRKSCFEQIKQMIKDDYDYSEWNVNESHMTMTHVPTGNQILFAGLDDVEKLKSIYEITGIWIEEATEIEPTDFRQLNIRLRGKCDSYLQMILTFNPISVTHWLKRKFFDKRNPRATILKTTYLDNRFLEPDQKIELEALKEEDPYAYDVYCLGKWGVTGETYFNKVKVSERMDKIVGKEPLRRGEFISGIFFDSPCGYIKIFKDPEPGHPYVLAGDTAGEGSDYFTAHVIDNSTDEQVAVLRCQHMDEGEYADQVVQLGYAYNTALIGLEVNFSTYPMKKVAELDYPNLFVRIREDNFTGKLDTSFGFHTNSKTRPIILGNLAQIVQYNIDTINDYDTLDEMLTFVRNEKSRPEAVAGSHDDLVMALAIAHYIKEQQITAVRPVNKKTGKILKTEWAEDQWEDYDRCKTEEEQRFLINLWGEPANER